MFFSKTYTQNQLINRVFEPYFEGSKGISPAFLQLFLKKFHFWSDTFKKEILNECLV